MKAGSLLRFFRWRQVGALLMFCLPLVSQAQFRGGRTRYMDDLNGDYTWTVDPAFQEDVFTFARLEHDSGGGYGYGRRTRWDEDAPQADTILSFRLHEITSINVRPGFNPIEITKENLAKFPFVYMAGIENLALEDQEVSALRNYLLSGGFMMVDNFWGDAAWRNFTNELRRIFPDRTPVELQLDDPIFRTVYPFKAKPQIPTAGQYERYGVFYDIGRDYDIMTHAPHYFAMYDDKGRMMMIICHNNHFGDGWEHEGEDSDYFHVISEGMAYPMFINIVTYAMTH